MRTKPTILFALPLAFVVGLVGCASSPDDSKPPRPTTSSNEAQDKIAASPEAKPDPLGDQNDSSGPIGTRGNPAPAGTPATFFDSEGSMTYTVTIGAVTMNAEAEYLAAVPEGGPAEAGSQYLLFPVTYKLGSQGTPAADISIEFVTTAGTLHDRNTTPHRWYPGELLEDIDFSAGLVNPTPMVITAPSEDISKGLLAVSLSYSDERFYLKLG